MRSLGARQTRVIKRSIKILTGGKKGWAFPFDFVANVRFELIDSSQFTE